LSKIVLDTSIVINGQIIELVESDSVKDSEIIIPEAVIDELQSQASQNKEEGFVGLEEIKKLQELSSKHGLQIRFEGGRPSVDDVRLSSRGRIDAIIKDVAQKNHAILFTSDRVQSLVAEAEGVEVNYQKPSVKNELEFLRFFDSQTMSVHLKEGLPPMAKRGKPGSFELTKIEDNILSRDSLLELSTQILEASKTTDSGSIEISKPGALVIQHEDYRIAITCQDFLIGQKEF
jgi:ATPase